MTSSLDGSEGMRLPWQQQGSRPRENRLLTVESGRNSIILELRGRMRPVGSQLEWCPSAL